MPWYKDNGCEVFHLEGLRVIKKTVRLTRIPLGFKHKALHLKTFYQPWLTSTFLMNSIINVRINLDTSRVDCLDPQRPWQYLTDFQLPSRSPNASCWVVDSSFQSRSSSSTLMRNLFAENAVLKRDTVSRLLEWNYMCMFFLLTREHDPTLVDSPT